MHCSCMAYSQSERNVAYSCRLACCVSHCRCTCRTSCQLHILNHTRLCLNLLRYKINFDFHLNNDICSHPCMPIITSPRRDNQALIKPRRSLISRHTIEGTRESVRTAAPSATIALRTRAHSRRTCVDIPEKSHTDATYARIGRRPRAT